MIIKYININKIEPYWRNPRKNDNAVESCKESIVKFGFKVPIIVDKNNVIVTGHTRYIAVNQLKGTLDGRLKELNGRKGLLTNLAHINKGEIPVICATEMTEQEAKEYRIVDNKIPELSSWDDEKLMCELRELESVVGFDTEEIESLLETAEREFESYTQDDIDETEKDIMDNVKGFDSEMVEIICPSCHYVFQVTKDEILKEKPVKKEP